MDQEEQRIYEKAIRAFGYKVNIEKTVEELLELSLDIIHYESDKVNLAQVIGELADVEITTNKYKLILAQQTNQDIDSLVEEVKIVKLEKLSKLIENTRRSK